MRRREIIRGLHLDEARGGAPELERRVAGGVEGCRRCGGAADQLDAMLVEGIDQRDETFDLVAPGRFQRRDVVDDDGVEMGRDGKVIGGAERPAAQLGKREAGDAAPSLADPAGSGRGRRGWSATRRRR